MNCTVSNFHEHDMKYSNIVFENVDTYYLKQDKSPRTCSLIMQAKVGPSKAPGRAVSRRPPTKRSTSDTVLVKGVCQARRKVKILEKIHRRYRSTPLVDFGEKLYICRVHHLVFRVYQFKLPMMIAHYRNSIFFIAGWWQSVIKRTSFNSSKFWREGRLAQSDLKAYQSINVDHTITLYVLYH